MIYSDAAARFSSFHNCVQLLTTNLFERVQIMAQLKHNSTSNNQESKDATQAQRHITIKETGPKRSLSAQSNDWSYSGQLDWVDHLDVHVIMSDNNDIITATAVKDDGNSEEKSDEKSEEKSSHITDSRDVDTAETNSMPAPAAALQRQNSLDGNSQEIECSDDEDTSDSTELDSASVNTLSVLSLSENTLSELSASVSADGATYVNYDV